MTDDGKNFGRGSDNWDAILTASKSRLTRKDSKPRDPQQSGLAALAASVKAKPPEA